MEQPARAEGITGMDGEKKFVLVSIMLVILCVTILFSLLFIALWQYKIIVGVSLLVILLAGTFSLCVAALRGNTFRQLPQPPYQSLWKDERMSQPYDNFRY
jgi:hypothetical protein